MIWKPLYVNAGIKLLCKWVADGESQDSHCWRTGCKGEKTRMIYVLMNLSLRHLYDSF